MKLPRAFLLGLTLGLGGTCVLHASPAVAEDKAPDAPPSAERIRAAAEEYDKGRRSYVSGEYAEAAIHFENAYNDAPTPEALRNAIRARVGAKQLARAATLSALAKERYEKDGPTFELAQKTLKEAEPLTHAVVVTCTPECAIATDGKVAGFGAATRTKLYLDPGPHDLVITFSGDRSKRAHVEAKAAGKEELAFDAPKEAPRPPPEETKVKPPPDVVVVTRKPLSPWVFWVGVGLTAVAGGAAVYSGIDAQENPGPDAVKRACVGQGDTCPEYQQGKDAEFRTNVLLGVTGGLALVTGVVGLFLTQWSDPRPHATGPTFRMWGTPSGGGAGFAGSF